MHTYVYTHTWGCQRWCRRRARGAVQRRRWRASWLGSVSSTLKTVNWSATAPGGECRRYRKRTFIHTGIEGPASTTTSRWVLRTGLTSGWLRTALLGRQARPLATRACAGTKQCAGRWYYLCCARLLPRAVVCGRRKLVVVVGGVLTNTMVGTQASVCLGQVAEGRSLSRALSLGIFPALRRCHV